jgi:hypothetical protein
MAKILRKGYSRVEHTYEENLDQVENNPDAQIDRRM